MGEMARTNWQDTIFAKQPGLASERFGAPEGSREPEVLASERYEGVRPLGQIVQAVVNGQILDFRRDGPMMMSDGVNLTIPSPVAPTLPLPDGKTGRPKRIEAFASSTWKQCYVLGPLTQIVYLSLPPDNHLRMVRFFPAPDGRNALLLYEPQGGTGRLAIFSPGSFLFS